jgi:hypothetical protein
MFTEMGVVLRNRLCVMGSMTVETRQMKRAAHPIGERRSSEVISWLLTLSCRKYSKVFLPEIEIKCDTSIVKSACLYCFSSVQLPYLHLYIFPLYA